jgi:carbamoyl-phosphate synthase large subunit
MKSTGEVMGADREFGYAYAKAAISAGVDLPQRGVVFISVNERDKRSIVQISRGFQELGFQIVATRGTLETLHQAGLDAEMVYKVNEGRPNVVDLVKSKKVDLIVNTPLGRESFFDEKAIRRVATQYQTPCITTLSAAKAAVSAVRALQRQEYTVTSLQEYHPELLTTAN